MLCLRNGFALLCLPVLAASPPIFGDSDARLTVSVSPAVVELTPLPADRPLRLPTLEFPAQIEASCPGTGRIDSVSISIADSGRSYRAADFDAGSRLETTLILPQQQTGPLDIGNFCSAGTAITDDSAAPLGVLRFDELFSAHASLRCSVEAEPVIVYETLSLDVELRCNAGGLASDAEASLRNPRSRR